MKKNKLRLLWASTTIILLIVFYFICQYIFFDVHGMDEWPFDLLVFGLIVLLIALLLDARKLMICVPLGYIIGFVIGVIFETNIYDENSRTYLNNLWILWSKSMVGIILFGVILEIMCKYLKKYRHKNEIK